jgi:hypothetical protein
MLVIIKDIENVAAKVRPAHPTFDRILKANISEAFPTVLLKQNGAKPSN